MDNRSRRPREVVEVHTRRESLDSPVDGHRPAARELENPGKDGLSVLIARLQELAFRHGGQRLDRSHATRFRVFSPDDDLLRQQTTAPGGREEGEFDARHTDPFGTEERGGLPDRWRHLLADDHEVL